MLELHRTYPDAYADAIEDRLQELVLAHRVVPVPVSGDGAPPADGELPMITQSGRTYRGREEIDAFLDELTAEILMGRRHQSDVCVLDPDDPSRCL